MGWIILGLSLAALLFIAFMWYMSACACVGNSKNKPKPFTCKDCRTLNSCAGCELLNGMANEPFYQQPEFNFKNKDRQNRKYGER